ncbi:plasmid mobilization protein [Henriciella pelagia]|uniref:plasmid mobilization protein n=1 Tax=Henriciella pelagia TaxID=1977912 RepID=UPI003515B783
MPPKGHRKSRAEVRSERIDVYVTPTELAAINEAAETCDQTRAAFVRACALGARPQAKPARVTADAIRQLTSIGNNLNQLAKQANASFVVSAPAVHATLDAVLSAVRRLG